MQERTHKCQICGAEYKACNSCDKYHNWMSVVDNQKCYLVYLAVTENRLGITDDSGFVSALAKAGVNKNNLEQKNFIEPVKAKIREVLIRTQKSGRAAQQSVATGEKTTNSKVSAIAEAEDK